MLGRRVIFINFRRISIGSYLLAALLVLFLLFLLMLTIFEHNMKPTIQQIAEAKARWVATEAVNRAVKDKVAHGAIDYNDLISVQKDDGGHVVLMQPNIVRINQLASDTTLAIQNSLKEMSSVNFSIPVGQVLGSELLANYGPRIGVSVYPVGTVRTNVYDRFEEAGINQTRHRLYLDIESQVRVVVPLITSDVKVTTQVPVTDTIIVGQVPQTYLNLNGKDLLGTSKE